MVVRSDGSRRGAAAALTAAATRRRRRWRRTAPSPAAGPGRRSSWRRGPTRSGTPSNSWWSTAPGPSCGCPRPSPTRICAGRWHLYGRAAPARADVAAALALAERRRRAPPAVRVPERPHRGAGVPPARGRRRGGRSIRFGLCGSARALTEAEARTAARGQAWDREIAFAWPADERGRGPAATRPWRSSVRTGHGSTSAMRCRPAAGSTSQSRSTPTGTNPWS
jgi:hypothetical protein